MSGASPHRVILWGTGFVGHLTLKEVIEHPDFDLVGLVVHTPEKVGVDAGTLVGLPPIGVTATDDVEAALAVDADAVAYFAQAGHRYADAIDDMTRALRAGKNVVSTSLVGFVAPTATLKGIVEPIEEACRAGGTSFFMTGSDPGFCNDVLPMMLTGFVGRVDTLRIQQLFDWSTYPNTDTLFVVMGFGRPMDETPLMASPGAVTAAWGGSVRLIADALDVELDEIRETHDQRATESQYEVAGSTIARGTRGALRHEVIGVVGGRPRIVLEGVSRIAPDVAPDWPRADRSAYRILLEGSPNVSVELSLVGEDGDSNTGACLASGMRAIQAIPAVCAAPPGVLEPLDLPLIPGRHAMRVGTR